MIYSSKTDGLFLDSAIGPRSNNILIIPDCAVCNIVYQCNVKSINVFQGPNTKILICFQTIFSLSNHGQRRSLPSMTAALTKPLAFQRTLTTLTEYQLFFFTRVHSHLKGKMCFSLSLKVVYQYSAVLSSCALK